MSLLRLEDMPDEILLKILTNLEIKDLIRCGQLCKRIRAISSDESMKRQRLSLDGMKLNYKIINKVILHNGKALTVLNLRNCKGLYMGTILDIVQHCVELTEFNLASTNLCRDSLNFLANNLTPTVVKLSLQNLKQLQDKHVSAIVKRCNKMTALDLSHTATEGVTMYDLLKFSLLRC